MLNFQGPYGADSQPQHAVATKAGGPGGFGQLGSDDRTPIGFQPRESPAAAHGDRAGDSRHRLAERAQPRPALALDSGPGYSAVPVLRFHD